MASAKNFSKNPEVDTATSTNISTRLAYGLISLAAISGLLFFATSGVRLNAESLAAPAVIKSQLGVLELTDQALKLAAENITQAKASTAARITKLLAERKEKILLLMGEPEKALLSTLPAKARAMFSINDQDLIEKTISLRGTYHKVEADFGALEEPETYYSLETGDSSYNIHFRGDISNLQDQSLITINEAIVLDNEALITETDSSGQKNVNQIETMNITTATVTQKKNLVVLFKFSDETRPEPMTVDQVKAAVFTASNSVSAYYNESTHGNFQLIGHLDPTGDVTGWYTISSLTPVTPLDCYDYFDWVIEANALAVAAGYDSDNYDNTIFIMPLLPSGFSICPWAGIAGGFFNLINGAGTSPNPNYVNARIISHELGHNYFLGHANSRRCYDSLGNVVPLSKNCVNDEYGDPFDVMGSAVTTRQLSVQNKYFLGALNSENSVDGSAGGTFTLEPIEQASAGYQRLYLTRGTSSPLFIEFRQPYGIFDNFSPTDPAVNGLLVRLVGNLEGSGTYLLDMTPLTPNDDMLDAALPVGQSFLDETYGYDITTVSAGPSGAVVNIQKTTPTCQYGTITAEVSPESQTVEPGSTVDYSLTVTNHDTDACPNVRYSLSSTLPADWTQTVSPRTLGLIPGETKTIIVSVTAPLTAEVGAYTLSETIVNYYTKAVEATKNMTAIIYAPDTVPPEAVDDLRAL